MRDTLNLLTPGEFRRRQHFMPVWPYLTAAALLATSLAVGVWENRAHPIGADVISKGGYTTAVLVTVWATFRWGRRCGFVVHNRCDGFSLTNLLRNGVMSAVMFLLVVFLASPVIAIAIAISWRKS